MFLNGKFQQVFHLKLLPYTVMLKLLILPHRTRGYPVDGPKHLNQIATNHALHITSF